MKLRRTQSRSVLALRASNLFQVMYLRNVSSDALVLRFCCDWALEVHNRTSQWCDERWLVRIRDVDFGNFFEASLLSILVAVQRVLIVCFCCAIANVLIPAPLRGWSCTGISFSLSLSLSLSLFLSHLTLLSLCLSLSAVSDSVSVFFPSLSFSLFSLSLSQAHSDTHDPGYFPGCEPKKETTGVFPMDMSAISSVYSGRTGFELLYQMCITTVLWLSKRLLNVYIICMGITHMLHMSNNTDTKSSTVARVCSLWKQYRC